MADSIPVRLALGLGDQELEQRLRPALDADDELQVAVCCLAADHVVQCVEGSAVDAVVLAMGLHRLSESVLAQLEQAGMPTVLLVPEAAKALIGTKMDKSALDKLAAACSAACKPIDDKRGTREYRIKVAGVLARRAAQIARKRAGGK